MGIGIVVRDHEGSLIAALNCSLFTNLDPTSAEPYATWKMTNFNFTIRDFNRLSYFKIK